MSNHLLHKPLQRWTVGVNAAPAVWRWLGARWLQVCLTRLSSCTQYTLSVSSFCAVTHLTCLLVFLVSRGHASFAHIRPRVLVYKATLAWRSGDAPWQLFWRPRESEEMCEGLVTYSPGSVPSVGEESGTDSSDHRALPWWTRGLSGLSWHWDVD